MFKSDAIQLHFRRSIPADCLVGAHEGKHRDPGSIPNFLSGRSKYGIGISASHRRPFYQPPPDINSLRQTNIRFIALGSPAICDGSAIGVAKCIGRAAKRAL
jgi:hypothetical protein